MGPVPEHLISSADWQLVCTDGEKLPCHSMFLKDVSKVLADMFESIEKPQRGMLVDVPFRGSSSLANSFIRWVYQRDSSKFLDTSKAYQLAEIGHHLDAPGES